MDAPPLHQVHAEIAWGAVLCDLGRASDGLEAIEAGAPAVVDRREAWRIAEVEIERARCLEALSRSWDETTVANARATLEAVRGPDAWVTRRGDLLR